MKKNSKPSKRTVKEVKPKYQVQRGSPPPRVSARKRTVDIAIPAEVLKASSELAAKLNIPLSELYADALSAYVAAHQSEGVTAALDRVYAAEPSQLDSDWIKIQAVSLVGEDW